MNTHPKQVLRTCAALVFSCSALIAWPRAGLAAEPTASDRDTARTLVIDGRAKFAAKDYQGAYKAFKAAHEIMGVPTTGLDLAKAEEKLGLLVEARTTALDVTRMAPKPREPDAYTRARPAAAELAEKLAVRIPTLVIAVNGPAAGTALDIKLDSLAIPVSTLGLPRKVNPGTHTVTATASGYATEERKVTLGEGETLPLEITLAPVAKRPLSSERRPAAPATPTPSAEDTKNGGVPLWAWGAGAAGLAAIGVGVGFAVDYASVRGTVGSDCPGDVCDPRVHTTESMGELRTRWNRDLGLFVGFGAAGVLAVGAAIVGITTASPRDEQRAGKPTVGVVPWISAGTTGAVVTGAF